MTTQSSNRPLTSKAVTYKTLGGYEVIEYVERTVRAPAADAVRIEVKAAGVKSKSSMSLARGSLATVQSPGFYFPVGENRRHFRGLGGHARHNSWQRRFHARFRPRPL